MAYDASGKWMEQDEGVASRVAQITSKASPLMSQARAGAMRTSQKRGLLNSSMAATAGEDSVIRAATPMAQQEAQQASQRNQLEANLANQRGLLNTETAAALNRQREQIASQEKMQLTDNAASKERLGMQLTAQEKLALEDIRAQGERLTQQIGAQERISAAELATTTRNTEAELRSREGIAAADRDNQRTIQQIQQAGQDRERALASLVQSQQAYMSALSTISANDKIPAATRDAYLQSMSRQADSNMALIEQIMGVDLQWASSTYGTTGAGGLGPGRATPPPVLQTPTVLQTPAAGATRTPVSATTAPDPVIPTPSYTGGGFVLSPEVEAQLRQNLANFGGGVGSGSQWEAYR